MSEVQETDYSINLKSSVLWQYESAEAIKALTEAKKEWLDEHHGQFFDDWYRDVFNVDTINDFGVAIWGRILDIPVGRFNSTTTTPIVTPFGFGNFNGNFFGYNFYSNSGRSRELPIELKRLIIKMRYFALTTRFTIPEVNKFLRDNFSDYGPAYLQGTYDMSEMVYIFDFAVDDDLKFIFDDLDMLPRPSTLGVGWTNVAPPTPPVLLMAHAMILS